MHVFCNGERIRVDAERLADIVRSLGYGGRRVAVAVNETFVARGDWPSYRVRDEDRLDILSAVQGG